MQLYNRYLEVSTSKASLASPRFEKDELDRMAWTALYCGVWGSGYLLSQFVFSPDPQTRRPIHPFDTGISWTAEDADLKSAVVISLSASSKTARSFAYHLLRRPTSAGPLGLLQVTSSPSSISNASIELQSSYPAKAIAYSEISNSIEWVANLNTSKIVIIDFGARDNALDELLDSINIHSGLRTNELSIIQVGSQQKVSL
jgi:Protein of unknown function (DUF2855)